MGQYESRMAAVLIYFFEAFLVEHDLGVIYAPDGPFRLLPSLIRLPDVAYVSWDQFPNRELPAESILELAPDLAVEVLSASNTRREMSRKIGEYFRAGVRLVWLIDPATHTATVYTRPGGEPLWPRTDRWTAGPFCRASRFPCNSCSRGPAGGAAAEASSLFRRPVARLQVHLIQLRLARARLGVIVVAPAHHRRQRHQDRLGAATRP